MRPARLTALIVTSAVIVLLTGCVAAGPGSGSASSTSPSPTPTASPKPAAIVITGDRLSVVSTTGEVLGSADYSEGSQALIDLVTPVLGAGRDNPSPVDTECITPYAATSWGDPSANTTLGPFQVRTMSTPLIPEITAWVVTGTSEVNGIAIRSSTGFSVGDPIAPVVAALDPDELAGFSPSAADGGGRGYVVDTAGTIVVDGVQTLYGAAALELNDRVVAIGAPRTASRQGC